MWIIIFLLPYILYKANERPPAHAQPDKDRLSFLYLAVLTNFLWVAVFYLNAFLLIPRLLDKKKYFLYGVYVLGIFFIAVGIHSIIFKIFAAGRTFRPLNATVFSLAPFLLSLAGSAVWKMWSEKVKSDKLLQEKRQENLKTELSFLRSQISPHFVLNILNNITALIRMKSDKAEPAIMKLSALMQYMLYDTNEEKVLLKTEVEYLQSYIDLQQQRFGNRVAIHTSFRLENEWAEIEPMLIIPFVENAFKHGIGLTKKPEINIVLYTRDNILYFNIENKYNPDTREIKDKTAGIGLANVKRRIDLLYSQRNTLQIEKTAAYFKVSLVVHLHV
jgi:sensor histidine kinase YesM